MSLIDGIGDEVIEFFIGLLIILIGVAAWWSTRIVDRPLIRTVLVFERRSQNHQSHSNQSTRSTEEHRVEQQQQTQDQRNYVEDLSLPPDAEAESEVVEEKPPRAGTSMQSDTNRHSNTQDTGSTTTNYENSAPEDEQTAIVERMDSDACVLRKRRLEFFQNRQETLITGQQSADSDRNNDPASSSHSESSPSGDGHEEVHEPGTDSRETAETTLDEDDIRIKLKYINDDLKLVNGKLQEPLGDFKRRHFEFELANGKLVRLIFNGQVLQRDDMTLQGCGLFDNCVVHCLVHQKRTGPNERRSSGAGIGAGSSSSPTSNSGPTEGGRPRVNGQSTTQQGREWDLGNLFFAVVSFVLGAAWYFRYEYAQLYTVTATVALVGLTGIFTLLLVGMYFPDPEPPVQAVRS